MNGIVYSTITELCVQVTKSTNPIKTAGRPLDEADLGDQHIARRLDSC